MTVTTKGLTEELDKEIGRRLRVARKLRGKSVVWLSKQIGVSYQQVLKYEKGKNRISASLLFVLSDILEIDPCRFYKGLKFSLN